MHGSGLRSYVCDGPARAAKRGTHKMQHAACKRVEVPKEMAAAALDADMRDCCPIVARTAVIAARGPRGVVSCACSRI